MSKRLKVLIIMFFAVAVVGVGTICLLNQKGYFSSSAAGNICPIGSKCALTGHIKIKVINKTIDRPYGNVNIWVKTTDCNRSDSQDQDKSYPWTSTVPICQTKTDGSGSCTGNVCIGSSGMTRYTVWGTRVFGQYSSCEFKTEEKLVTVWGPEGTGTTTLSGEVVCKPSASR